MRIVFFAVLVLFGACARGGQETSPEASKSEPDLRRELKEDGIPVPHKKSVRPAPIKPASSNDVVVIHTSLGQITIKLAPKKAPATVANFLKLVRSGYYRDLIFHRVIKGFMIQAGGFEKDTHAKKTPPTKPVPLEAGSGLSNKRGTLSLARTANVNSGNAQFFINLVDNPFLDQKPAYKTTKSRAQAGYTVFGHVTSGMDVVDAIAKVSISNQGGAFASLPNKDVVILKIEIQ